MITLLNVVIRLEGGKNMGDFFKRFIAFQNELKAPKNQYNTFGKYNYRSAEDILDTVKPLEAKHNILIFVSDDVIPCGERVYVKATAMAIDVNGESEPIKATAFAREPAEKKGMDASQITGTASSYARKYALSGLLCIDDTKDADTNQYNAPPPPEPVDILPKFVCADCGKPFQDCNINGRFFNAQQCFEMAKKYSEDGVARCKECREKIKRKVKNFL